MKRLLLVSYYYPPSPAVGSIRPRGLAKYLPAFGWEVLVLTPRRIGTIHTPATVVETDYRDVLGYWKNKLHLDPHRGFHEQLNLAVADVPNSRLLHTKAIDWVKSAITYPDAMRGWIPFALEAVAEIAATTQIDAIVSTSPPISSHVIACRAKKILHCPWIADFRDIWLQGIVRNRLMRRVLSGADQLVTVSEPLAEQIGAHVHKPVACVLNGFDSEDVLESRRRLTERFSITYTGQLYHGKRDPADLLETVRELIDDGIMCPDDIQIRFYGPRETFLVALIRRLRLEKIVEVHDSVPRPHSLSLQAESQLLLMLEWGEPGKSGLRSRVYREGFYSGKLFEYFGSQRPVLSIGSDPGIAALLKHTRAGVQAKSKDELKQILIDTYFEYKSAGSVSYGGLPAAINRYTHREMASRFADTLNAVALEDLHVHSSRY